VSASKENKNWRRREGVLTDASEKLGVRQFDKGKVLQKHVVHSMANESKKNVGDGELFEEEKENMNPSHNLSRNQITW
jgi:hypothetical protein